MLDEVLVLRRERSGKMAVDIEFADDFAMHKHGHNDFGFGFEGTGEVTGILTHVVYYDCLAHWKRPRRKCLDSVECECAASWPPRNGPRTSTRRLRVHRVLLQHVEANPVVLQHAIVQQLCHGLHQFGSPARCFRQLADFVANFFE